MYAHETVDETPHLDELTPREIVRELDLGSRTAVVEPFSGDSVPCDAGPFTVRISSFVVSLPELGVHWIWKVKVTSRPV